MDVQHEPQTLLLKFFSQVQNVVGGARPDPQCQSEMYPDLLVDMSQRTIAFELSGRVPYIRRFRFQKRPHRN